MVYRNKTTLLPEICPLTLGNGLLLLEIKPIKVSSTAMTAIKSNVPAGTTSMSDWHERFGHLSIPKLKHLIQRECSRDIKPNDIKEWLALNCEACAKGKFSRKPGFISEIIEVKTSAPGTMLHVDLSGKISPPFRTSGQIYNYFMVIVDDYSRKVFIRLLLAKSDALATLIDVISLIEKQTSMSVQKVKLDNGELDSNSFKNDYCLARGIEPIFTVAYNARQNGIAEVFVRIIKNIARPIHLVSALPADSWGYSILAAQSIKNMWPTKHLSDSNACAEELFTGKNLLYISFCNKIFCLRNYKLGIKPLMSHFRKFGCRVEVPIYEKRLRGGAMRIQTKTKIYLRPWTGGQFQAIDPLSGQIKNHTFKDCTFYEDQFPTLARGGKDSINLEDNPDNSDPMDQTAQDAAISRVLARNQRLDYLDPAEKYASVLPAKASPVTTRPVVPVPTPTEKSQPV